MKIDITEYEIKIHPSAIFPVCEAFGLGSYDNAEGLTEEQRETANVVTLVQTWRKRNGQYRADLADGLFIHRSVIFESAEHLAEFISELDLYLTKI